MNKSHLKKDLLPYYEETDCCSWIVVLRKENAELKEQVKKQKEVIDKIYELIKQHIRKDGFLELNEWQTRDLLTLLKEVSK